MAATSFLAAPRELLQRCRRWASWLRRSLSGCDQRKVGASGPADTGGLGRLLNFGRDLRTGRWEADWTGPGKSPKPSLGRGSS